jgi:hypothetical protein
VTGGLTAVVGAFRYSLTLVSMAPASFFIGDKKYGWLVYFRVDQKENTIALINVDGSPMPFDLV